jgi:hypothetical protein
LWQVLISQAKNSTKTKRKDCTLKFKEFVTQKVTGSNSVVVLSENNNNKFQWGITMNFTQ